MNPALYSQAVAIRDFLLPHPNSPLSMAFALVMLGCLTGGCALILHSWWGLGKAQIDATGEFGSRRPPPVPSEVESSLAARDWAGHLALQLPATVLALGLLGTFIGIGVAIEKAGSSFESTKDITAESMAGSPMGSGLDAARETAAPTPVSPSLQAAKFAEEEQKGRLEAQLAKVLAVLQGLGAKFQTSTWGIVVSLLLGWASRMGVSDQRREAARAVVKQLSQIARQEEAGLRMIENNRIKEADEWRSALLKAAQSHLEAATYAEHGHTQRRPWLSAVYAEAMKSREEIQGLSLLLVGDPKLGRPGISGQLTAIQATLGIPDPKESLQNKLTSVRDSVHALPGAATKIEEAAKAIKTEMEKFGTTITPEVTHLAASATAVESAAKAMGTAAAAIGTQVQISLDKFSNEAVKEIGEKAQTMAAAAGGITAAIGAMKDHLGEALTTLNTGTGHMVTAAQGTAGALHKMNAQAQFMTDTVAAFELQLTKVSETNVEVMSVLAQVKATFRHFVSNDSRETGEPAIETLRKMQEAMAKMEQATQKVQCATEEVVRLIAPGAGGTPALYLGTMGESVLGMANNVSNAEHHLKSFLSPDASPGSQVESISMATLLARVNAIHTILNSEALSKAANDLSAAAAALAVIQQRTAEELATTPRALAVAPSAVEASPNDAPASE